jgi:hypothetical protein
MKSRPAGVQPRPGGGVRSGTAGGLRSASVTAPSGARQPVGAERRDLLKTVGAQQRGAAQENHLVWSSDWVAPGLHDTGFLLTRATA